jgi:eukaryotic-like serine/threonine-protein kinase
MKFTFPPESRPLDGYTIKRAIHRGGFGEVYYALSDAGKEVALKLLQQNLEIELRGVRQCMNLKHPNLVTIFDIRTDGDNDHWIVMEYVHGKSLDRIIDEANGPLPMDEIGGLLAGMAAGLSFLHDRGIVHRDLKPANVFLENGVVKIGDVGLAKFITQSKRSAQTESVGTVYYMAPEVARGRYGHEVDVYSLGIVLYEMLTGRVPFDGESTAEILMKHLSERPDLTPLPKRLRPVLANALEKDPLKRTPTADQLLAEFRKAVSGVEIPTTIPEESFHPAARAGQAFQLEQNGASEPIFAANVRHVDRKAERHARIEARRAARHARRMERRRNREGHRAEQDGHYAVAVPVPAGSPAVAARAASNTKANLLKLGAIAVLVTAIVMPGSLAGLARGVAKGALLLVPGYLVYLFFFKNRASKPVPRAIPVTDRDRPIPPPYVPANRGAGAQRSPGRRVSPYTLAPETVREIPLRTRLTDLTGSLAFAVVATAVITAAVAVLSPVMQSAVRIGLFAAGTLLASWAVLITAKTYEGTRVGGGHRRFMQCLAGCLVGAAAFGVQQFLFVQFQHADYNVRHSAAAGFYSIGSVSLSEAMQPSLAGYVVFFGGLFLLRHWWRNADSLRYRRVGVGSVLLTTLVGLVLSLLLAFPMMWGVTWAAAIACVVQLSAAWFSPEERRQLTEARDVV